VLNDSDLMKVQAATSDLSRAVTLVVHTEGTADPFEKNLLNIARQVAGVSLDLVRLEESVEPVEPGKPSITLAAERARNIHYLAAPEGPELEPFLAALAWLGEAKALPDSQALGSINKIGAPAELLVLIAAECPHCPSLVRKTLAMAVRQPLIRLVIADAIRFEDLALKYKVRSTPTLIVNQNSTLVGDVDEETIVRHLLGSDDAASLTEVLESMIAAGRAEDAGRLMVRRHHPDAILPLYLSSHFPLRLGALVAMEEALEQDPRSLDRIVEDLMELLFHEDKGLRGDTAALFGKIGDPRAIPSLRRAAQDPDPDVREAVEEALELLKPSQKL
jgi:hypothetical protein